MKITAKFLYQCLNNKHLQKQNWKAIQILPIKQILLNYFRFAHDPLAKVHKALVCKQA